jgi:hypothetical protein
VGKTWRGEFAGSTPGKPAVDVARWELALNGQAVRILHSLNDGEYGGETLIVWDKDAEALVFYYFTTEGFYTTGGIEFQGGDFLTREAVTGSDEGITEVEATHKLLPDGRLHVTSRHFKMGAWVPGHEVYYAEAPDAEVRFK